MSRKQQLEPGDYCIIEGDGSGTIYQYKGPDPVNPKKKHILFDPVSGTDNIVRSLPKKIERPKASTSAEAIITDQAEEITTLKAEAEARDREFGELSKLCDAQAEAIDKISQAMGGPSGAAGIDLDELVAKVKDLAAKSANVGAGSGD